ncbi:MAG: hypothetical protein K2H04_06150 [Bacteroidaceae bacterium]|nr:hypothetical protein [Bacteroidaceae bacterium]MDE5999633.1 hypothetical protein [Bacteroidaceae bacterium]
MSPTSVNRSPRHRPTDVGDSDLEAVKAHYTQKRPTTDVSSSMRGRKGPPRPQLTHLHKNGLCPYRHSPFTLLSLGAKPRHIDHRC